MKSPSQSGCPRTGRYAWQLDEGIEWLWFRGDMEREYALQIDRDERRPAVICAAFSLVFVVLFGAADFARLPLVERFPDLTWDMWGIVASRVATILTLLGCVCISRMRNDATRLAPLSVVGVLTLAVCGAVAVCLYKRNHLPHAEFVQILFVAGAFLPLGLRFRHSLFLACVVAATIFVLRYAMLPPELHGQQFNAMLLMTLIFSAVGGYLREHAHREQFLLRGLLKEQASHDPLTGLANRRRLDEQLEVLCLHARRENASIGLLLIDIDFFKRYNDGYGHRAGDLALQRVAACIESFARRPLDLACRMGGEEFVLLLYDCEAATLKERADLLCAEVRALAIDHAASDVGTCLTLSIGGASVQPQEGAGEAFDRADRLLYNAKQTGRNRACVEYLPAEAAVA